MGTLTNEQRELMIRSGGRPFELVDPESNEHYVLIRAEEYEQLRTALGESDPRDLYPALHQALREEGWDDPRMDDYNRYG
jgi:hypothetical protein